jgi:RNA polymerase sigma-70 factor (ECF subfamily)
VKQPRSQTSVENVRASDHGRRIPLSDASTRRGLPLLDLLRRVAHQDRDAFAALYDVTAAKLYGLILRMVRRRDAADDILQDVYIRIWERAADFDVTKGAPMAWMGTIARNRTLDELRRNTPPPTPAMADAEVPEAVDEDLSPLASLEQSQDLGRLLECLDKLEAERRDIVLLAYRDGFSRDDLSRRFARPVGTIKTWLRRSLVQLRICLDQ